MDIRTGRTYATKDEALADGVPESDIAEVTLTPKGPEPTFTNPKYPVRHQSLREMRRRSRRAEGATTDSGNMNYPPA